MQDDIEKNATQLITAPHFQTAHDLQNELLEEKQKSPEDKQVQAQYDNVLEMNALLYDLSNAIENEHWDRIPELESHFLDTVVTHLDAGGSFPSFSGEELQQSIEKNAILLEHHLPYEDVNYSLTAINFTKIAAVILFSFLGMLMLVFILGDQLSEELENHTIRTLNTQPVKIGTLLLGKYIGMMVGVLFVCFIFIIVCLAVPLIFGKDLGSLAYPQLVLYEHGFTYITIADYLIKLFVLFIGCASFACSLVLLCSVLLKNRFSTFLISLLVLLIGSLFTNGSNPLQTPWNPFYYFRLVELIEHPGTEHVSFVFLLFVYSFITLYLCYIVQKRRFSFQLEAPHVRPFNKGKVKQSSSRIAAILLFEGRKIWRQGYLKQIIIVLFLLVIGGYLFILFQTHQMEQHFIQTQKQSNQYTEQEMIPWYEKNLKDHETHVEEWESKDDLNEEEKARLEAAPKAISDSKKLLEHEQLLLKQSEEMLTAYQDEDWDTYYDYWIYKNRLNKGEIKVTSTSETHIDKSFFTFNASIAEKELLAKRQLRPVQPSEYIYTIYEEFPHQFEQIKWKKETQKLDSTGIFNLYSFFDWFIYMIPLGLLVFLLGAGFTTEKGKKRTLFIMRTQPLSNIKVFTGKAITSVVAALGSALGLLALIVLLGTIGNRFGDWDFPVLHYDTPDIVGASNYAGITSQEGGFHFITMGKYLAETSVLFFAMLLFLIVLSLFFSLFMESMIHNFIVTALLSAGGYFLTTTSAASSIAPFLPFTYLNVGKIANGETATVLNNNFIHPWLGTGILLLSAVIIFGVGIVIFQKAGRKRHKHKKQISHA